MDDPILPRVFGRSEALTAGMTRNQIENRLKRRAWIPLRRGVFCTRETYDATAPDSRHLLHAEACRRARSSLDLVESHICAAARWGLPMPIDGQPRATLTDGLLSRSTRADSGSVIQVATLWPGDVRQRNGVPMTSPARTVADCLRHYRAEIAVPIADAALRARLTDSESISFILGRQATWPYAARAAASVPLVDGRRESWLESVSTVRLSRHGIAVAEPQVEVFDARGTFVARVDGLWRAAVTVGEADGRAKYSLADWPELAAAEPDGLAEAHVEAATRVVLREKAREDALRDLGLEVVRWTSAEILGSLSTVVRRIERAWARSDPARFTGHFRSTSIA